MLLPLTRDTWDCQILSAGKPAFQCGCTVKSSRSKHTSAKGLIPVRSLHSLAECSTILLYACSLDKDGAAQKQLALTISQVYILKLLFVLNVKLVYMNMQSAITKG